MGRQPIQPPAEYDASAQPAPGQPDQQAQPGQPGHAAEQPNSQQWQPPVGGPENRSEY